MQVRPQKYWIKRNLFYLAKMYTEDLKSGQRYERLRKCIAISILDFDLLPGDEYHSVYTLRDKFGNEFTDLLEIHIIELNKEIRPEDAVGEWIQVFTAGSLEELEMIKTKNAGILEAMEVMKTMSLGKRLRMAYEAHLKAVRDRWAEDEYVRDLGKKEGKAEGKAEVLLLLLAEKGSVPAALSEIIRREKDTDRLDEWVKIAAKAGSIDEFRAKSKI